MIDQKHIHIRVTKAEKTLITACSGSFSAERDFAIIINSEDRETLWQFLHAVLGN